METVFFKGMEVHTSGCLPPVGAIAPDFCLAGNDLRDVILSGFRGKRVVLNVFPSLDTPVCATSVRWFNSEAAALDNTVVVCVSMDLPFAMNRFCTVEGLDNVIAASAFRSPSFAGDYGLGMEDGPLRGLLARAVIVVDESGRIIYRQLVGEVTEEPDYDAAVASLGRRV